MPTSIETRSLRRASLTACGRLLAALAFVPAVVTAAPTPSLSPAASSDAAFVALLSAPSDGQRHYLAEAFLEQHGADAPVTRQATAHALLGAALWRASCPDDADGLCIDAQPVALAPNACLPALRDRLVPRPRAPQLAEAALDHLEQASWLIDVPPPADPDEAAAFHDAIAQALVLLADHDLETLLALEPPTEPFSPEALHEASSALSDYTHELMASASALISAYAEVKTTGSAGWVLVAAARTGMAMETPAEALNAVAMPPGLDADGEAAYCEELGGTIATMRQQARGVYAWCVERSAAQEGNEVCDERLAVLDGGP